MNRRTFLCGLGKFLGSAAVAAVAPKFIFDPNAKLYTTDTLTFRFPEYRWGTYLPTFTPKDLSTFNLPNAQYRQIGNIVEITFSVTPSSMAILEN